VPRCYIALPNANSPATQTTTQSISAEYQALPISTHIFPSL
jgi:hypothetical protein